MKKFEEKPLAIKMIHRNNLSFLLDFNPIRICHNPTRRRIKPK